MDIYELDFIKNMGSYALAKANTRSNNHMHVYHHPSPFLDLYRALQIERAIKYTYFV